MSKVLVTGGCGYIGSHTIVALIEKGHQVVCLDNYINSYREALDNIEKITGVSVKNYDVDLKDKASLESFYKQEPDITAIIHFAALKSVGQSVSEPILYFRNNVSGLINLLDAAKQHIDLKHFIFSSSCTVYGESEEQPVTESTPMQEAASPYGRTKQIGEFVIKDAVAELGMSALSLRYFNPAGAHFSGLIGESSRQYATNLVPVITETALGKREKCTVFGDDYNTRDGSCIRDYIHVVDLAEAHVKALDYLIAEKNKTNFEVFNLGIGNGVTVLEAIKAFEKISGTPLNYEIGAKRPGDIAAIYAETHKAKTELGWVPKYGIEDIMKTAWAWENNRLY